MSNTLEAVVAQQLMPRIGHGRIVAIEILIATAAVRNLIREGKTYQLYTVLETGSQYGMQTMDKVLAEVERAGKITHEEATARAMDKDNIRRFLQGG